MATKSSSNLPEFIDNTWINQSPEERLRAIEQMQQHGAAAQAALLHIARHDENTKVRCGAVRFLTDINVLAEFQSADSAIADTAQQQLHRLLAGAAESNISETDRLAAIRSLPLPAVKQIALLAKSKSAGSAALERITQPEELADLSLFAASAHVRKHAVMKIDDTNLLRELYEKLRDKDKTVAKLLEQRLAEQTPDTRVSSQSPDPVLMPASSNTESAEFPAETPAETTEETPAEAISKKPVEAAKPKKPKKKSSKAEAERTQPELDPALELPLLEQQFTKLSFKHTDALNAQRNTLNKLRKVISADNPELSALAETLHKQLSEKLEKNHTHQEHLREVTTALLETLQQALDSGRSHDALPAWDKIQGNISNTSGKIRAALQKQANVHKLKLNELRDWKTFAATEKKKELLSQMQHLLESKMHAADRSRHISKMHAEWKSLGRSNQNEQLWREFKKISDKAYEPCKEYFKQRKQLMATNFQKRREICEQLETEVAKLDTEKEPDISQMNKLLNEADKLWKEHAPIEQSRIKPLQKRYYAAINQLRKSRKQSLRGNSTQKLEFIAQANALAEHEDNQHAMREAKTLQQEWKKIGPTSFKEDRKLWEDFRAACDKIFAKRNQEVVAQKATQKQEESQLGELLQAIEAILQLDDEAFRGARNEYQTLAQQFSNSIDPHQRNQAKRVMEQFNGLKRKIDSRFKSLPDKKQLQLKNTVLEKARFLQDIESKLLACEDDNEFANIKGALDAATWQEFASSGDNKYDQALDSRMQRILQVSSLQSLREIADKCADQARALCIELEIRANVDTPKEDQGLRMQIQLDQLKNGFGKLKPDPKENGAFAMDMELQSYCLGPIDAGLQQQLSRRLEGAIRKLI